MCGIGGYYRIGGSFKDVEEPLQNMFVALENRGTDAAGMAWLNKHHDICTYIKDTGSATELINSQWHMIEEEPQWCMLHTRNGTHGTPLMQRNNHPIERFGIILTHNGVIFNKNQVMDALNVRPKAEVDSEVLPVAIAKEGLKWTASNIRGSFTIAWTSEENQYKRLSFFSNGIMPLHFGILENTGDIIYASTRNHLAATGLNFMQVIHAIPGYHYQISTEKINKFFVGGLIDRTIGFDPRREHGKQRATTSSFAG